MESNKNLDSLWQFLVSPIAILIYLGFFIYLSALNGSLIWDDTAVFQNIEDLKGQGFFKLFEGNIFNSLSYYRPIGAIYFSVMSTLFGQTTFPYHFLQISLHIFNAILVYKLFRKLLDRNLVSYFLALVFLVHPINVESVSYISSTVSVLSFSFGISAFYLALSKKLTLKYYLTISLLLLLSVLTKEIGFGFIVVTILYILIFREKLLFKFIILALSIGGIYGLMRLFVTDVRYSTKFYVPITELSFIERLLHIPTLIIYYLTTFIYPQNLAINQLWVLSNINFVSFYLPLIIVILLILGAWLLFRRIFRISEDNGLIFLFFFMWFVVGLSFYMQIIPLQNTVAEKWFYFPMIGILGVIGITFKTLPKKILPSRSILITIAVIVILLLSVRTMIRNNDWQNELTLLKHDIAIENNYQMESNLGSNYYTIKSYKLAEEHLKRSLELYPDGVISWYKLGMVYAVTGERDKAEACLKKAIALDSNFDLPYFSLAMISYEHDGPQKALPLVENLVKKFPEKALYREFHDQILIDLGQK